MADPLDSFEHVVVLMLENRPFDNLLGYLYQNGVPPGKQFAGVVGNNLSNPDVNGDPVPVSAGLDFHQPYPDPGEDFDHVTAQLFSGAPPTGVPQMQGFVKDYYSVLTALPGWTGSAAAQSQVIMHCFPPSSVPVLSGLAQQFAVFDHWFCAVPSQTWCNRAFWHAATSWGWVNNPPLDGDAPWDLDSWAVYSQGSTIFDLLEAKFGIGSWCVYEDLAVGLTKLIHWGSLKDKEGSDYFRYFEGGRPFFKNFFYDCAHGRLPKYSFIEPHFINFFEDVIWHDDMHPSSFDSTLYSDGGPGSVLLGDQIIWKVYQAIRSSNSAGGNNWQNTLLIITFDEHGGGFDHISPPAITSPDPADFNTGMGQEGFNFERLGVRVPMVMVSANIAENTIVNSPMNHNSFLQTMAQKWELPSLGPRQDSSPPFTEVFSSSSRSLDTWPNWTVYPGPASTLDEAQMRIVDPANAPLNPLQQSIIDAIREFYAGDPAVAAFADRVIETAGDAKEFLEQAEKLRHPNVLRAV
ncbi:MAG TPA: alkaline phosphatase family protein [Pyrinomonadaceae bacterium]|nr:alkaline phosphatase family protein [Pyrinomonadaceae bacterium]